MRVSSMIAILAVAKPVTATTFFDSLSATNGGTNSATSTNWLAARFTTDNATYSSLTATLSLANHSLAGPNLDLYSDNGSAPGR